MWHIMFIMLLIFAILLMICSIQLENHAFWNIIMIVVSVPLWFILGLAQMEIEIPYQIFNNSSGNIETSYQVFTSPISPFLTYFFMGIGLIMMIYLIAMVYDKWINWKA